MRHDDRPSILQAYGILDETPAGLTTEQEALLRDLAGEAEARLEQHRLGTAPLPPAMRGRAPLLEAMAAGGVATALLDRDGRYGWWSTECAELLGWTAAEVLGRSPLEFAFGVEAPVEVTAVRRRLAVDGRWHATMSVLRADGTLVTADVFAVPLVDGAGRVEAYLTGMADPLPRPSAGELESVLIRSAGAVLLCDRRTDRDEAVIVYANPAACALVGRELAEMAGRPLTTVLRRRPSAGQLTEVSASLRAGESVRSDDEVTRPDGGTVAVEVTMTRFGDAGGVGGHLVVVAHDVSARRSAEREAAAATARLHAVARLAGVMVDVTDAQAAADRAWATLESINEGYQALDRDWRFTYVNRASERLLGRRREELLGRDARLEFPEIVGTVIEEQYQRAMGGEQVTFETYVAPADRWYEIRAYPQPGGIVVHYRDISARVAQQAERAALLAAEHEARVELARAARRDPLTGLPNRIALLSWLTDTLARPGSAGSVAVLYCDVDRFSVVNDSLGLTVGDELLVAVAGRVTADVQPGDIVAHLGGDELVFGLSDTTREEAEQVAAGLLEQFRQPVHVAGRRIVLSASIGIAVAEPGATAETLLRDANAALHVAEDRGRDQAAHFDEAVRTTLASRLQTENELREAIGAGQLELHYQPSFDLRTGQVTGAEALLRWHHPTRGLLPAGQFIDLAEDTGLVLPIGDWVVPEACDAQRRAVDGFDDLRIWVNVSLRQLMRPGFAEHMVGLVEAAGCALDRIGVEVTEWALAEDRHVPLAQIRYLADADVRVAIDDFGTGYSSLSRLRHYPVDVLKLDRAFVIDAHTDAGHAVAASVVDLAHAVGAVALAEGIETPEQLDVVRSLGCDQASGFYLARPVPIDRLAEAVAVAPD